MGGGWGELGISFVVFAYTITASRPWSLSPFAPGERSFAETVAHLINTEWRTTESITLALQEREHLLQLAGGRGEA